jgi:hypothetical protein
VCVYVRVSGLVLRSQTRYLKWSSPFSDVDA